MSFFSDLSTPAKGMVLGVPISVGAADGLFILNGGNPWIVLGVTFVALLVAAVILWLVYRWIQKRRGKRFEGEIDEATRRSSGANKPEERAAMEDLRRRFLDGFKQYEREGFNPYEVPWYLVMGEPGSGKTFAVRQSGIGFLSGMQDERQGTGGTKTMDWWFTKSGVLLDTAGRWSTGSSGGQTLASQELAQFLRLLKKHRSRCPINGLILVLDGERMQNEGEAETREKARQLSEALFQVKRELDVRFPVIVWISKCDTIPGFRSYFESFGIAQQHQMLGWSNPASNVDEPFQPEKVEEYLGEVVAELRRRRWEQLYGLKLPGDARRADAVDSLFVFPSHLDRLTPAIRLYLEQIFGDMRRAPFLRGIYFNSAITEGAEVDNTIAAAMGVTPQEYRARSLKNSLFRKDRALFIKDTLAEKLFKERNLVTRASNAVAAFRRTQILFVSILVVCLAAMAAVAWLSSSSLKRDVGVSAPAWKLAAHELSPQKFFATSPAKLAYTGHNVDLTTNGVSMTPVKVLISTLADCSKDPRIPPPFGWISVSGSTQAERRAAWRKLYQKQYLEPFARYLLESKDTDAPTNREARVASLVRWDGLLAGNAGAQFLADNTFPRSLFAAFIEGNDLEIGENAQLLAAAIRTNLVATEWYSGDLRNAMRDRTRGAFSSLLADKADTLRQGRNFIGKAQSLADAQQAFVNLKEAFLDVADGVLKSGPTPAGFGKMTEAFLAWKRGRPESGGLTNLSKAGLEAEQQVVEGYRLGLEPLQAQLKAAGGVLAPEILDQIKKLEEEEVKAVRMQWRALTNGVKGSVEEISAASAAAEKLLTAMGPALELFGANFGPAPEKPLAGWAEFQRAYEKAGKQPEAIADDLRGVLKLAWDYQSARAAAAAQRTASDLQKELNRWPLADAFISIDEDQFDPLVAKARKALEDPQILGNPAFASITTNIARIVSVAGLIPAKNSPKKVALQIRVLSRSTGTFRSLILGDNQTIEFEKASKDPYVVALDGFTYKARFSETDEFVGPRPDDVSNRWGLLKKIWDPAGGKLWTNHDVELGFSKGQTITVKIGATWSE